MMRRRWAARVGITAWMLWVSGVAQGTEVRHFRADSREELGRGTLAGVSLDSLGRLGLARKAERLASIEEPYLLSAARHPEGWVVGTGNDGRVLLINAQGEVSTLFTAPEPQIYAVLADRDGTVWAASSPQGKVYRIRGGQGQVFFEPGQTYLWALAKGADGALLVATGDAAKVYRVGADGKGQVIFEHDDVHVRSLAQGPDGRLLVGTANQGLILSVDAQGKIRTLVDSAAPEVVALAVGASGEIWAAVINSEASWIEGDGERAAPPEAAAAGRRRVQGQAPAAETEPEASVTVSETPEMPAAATPAPRGSKSARTEILRLAQDGSVETVWTFTEETAYSLALHGGELWVGTGLDGKLFRFDGTSMTLENEVADKQIVALVSEVGGLALATTNAAALYRLSGTSESQGTYTSQPLDAGATARFGTLVWDGSVPAGTEVKLSARSGASAEPDATWSEWLVPSKAREIALSALPAGRYVQWQAELAGEGKQPLQLFAVDLSYRQTNARPVIRSFAALEAGQVLVPAGFNPGIQAYEPFHPTHGGIFTSLAPAPPAEERQKTLWKKGYRTFRWDASDPNGDALRYSLEFRPEEAGDAWLPVADDLEQSSYGFDSTVLPDGVYRFRLTASDAKANPPDDPRSAQLVGEPVRVDNTAPTVSSVRRQGGKLILQVSDNLSPLREASFSVDAGDWLPALPADGLIDAPRESFTLELPANPKLLLLRLIDTAFNVVTVDLSAKLAEEGKR